MYESLKCTPASVEVVVNYKKKRFPALKLIDIYNEYLKFYQQVACAASRAFVVPSQCL